MHGRYLLAVLSEILGLDYSLNLEGSLYLVKEFFSSVS